MQSALGRGSPLTSWERKVKQHIQERVGGDARGFEGAKQACSETKIWKHLCHGLGLVTPTTGSSMEQGFVDITAFTSVVPCFVI